MRLRRAALQTVYLRKRITERDVEGNVIHTYGEPIPLKANVQVTRGMMDNNSYGNHVPYIEQMLYQGDKIKKYQNENDGVCVYVGPNEDPDYKITSIRVSVHHLYVILEARTGHANQS